MPKDMKTARREDVKVLVLLAGIAHSEAMKRLDGARGPAAAGLDGVNASRYLFAGYVTTSAV
jgi:hypothetical protein